MQRHEGSGPKGCGRIAAEDPKGSKAVSKVMTHFGTTYRCESTFSFMKYVKNRLSNRLGDDALESYMRIRTTSFEPRVAQLAGAVQFQKRSK